MANKIQLRRGLKSSMPTGSAGEPLYATDTRELFVGTGSGNVNMGGSHWYRGTAMSGTSSSSNAYSYSACPDVKLDDIYMNTSNGNIYACTTAGKGSAAKWTYQGCIKGATGAKGADGENGSDATVTVDSELSSTSANPVQNKVIKAALDSIRPIRYDAGIDVNDSGIMAVDHDSENTITFVGPAAYWYDVLKWDNNTYWELYDLHGHRYTVDEGEKVIILIGPAQDRKAYVMGMS